MKTLKLLILFVCWLPSLMAQYKTIEFDNLGLKDGLSQSLVVSIYQDRKGFLWFSTQDGLNRYDGYNFKIFRPNSKDTNSLSNNIIWNIDEDSKGNLWVPTFGGGLNRYNPQTETITRFMSIEGNNKTLPTNNLNCCAVDKMDWVWVSHQNGLSVYKPEKNGFTTFTNNPNDSTSLTVNGSNYVLVDSKNNVWIATIGVCLYDRKTNSFKRFLNHPNDANSLLNNLVFMIEEDREGNIWFLLQGGLSKYVPSTGKFTNYPLDTNEPNGIHDPNLNRIFFDKKNTLWVLSTTQGVYRKYASEMVNGVEKMYFQNYQSDPLDATSLNHNNVLSAYEDNCGVLWFGTSSGLNKYYEKGRQFATFKNKPNNRNSLAGTYVFGLSEDKAGNLWIGTLSGGLNKYNPQTGIFESWQNIPTDNQSIPDNFVRAICEDTDGELWVGTTNSGICKFNPKTGKFKRYPINPNDPNAIAINFVSRIFRDNENRVWVGTFNGGLYLYQRDKDNFRRFINNPDNPTSLPSNIVRDMRMDSKGNLWIATQNGGLSVLRKENIKAGIFERYTVANDDSSIVVKSVFGMTMESDTVLWLGTYGTGLCRFNPLTGNTQSFTTHDGLPNDVVYGVLMDNDGNLWLSTNLGLCRFNPKTKQVKNFDINDGLQGNEFNAGSFYKTNDGFLMFGGTDGVNIFYPRDVVPDPNVPNVVFTDFQIFNESVKPATEGSILKKSIVYTKKIILSHREKVFSFEFAGLHFGTPENNHYSYMMEGFDKQWIELGNRRFVSFVNMPAGTYKLKVKAANSNGIWSEEYAEIIIVITPPFYKTIWFTTLMILLLLAAIASFIKIRERNLRVAKRILEEKVVLRTKEINRQKNEIEAQSTVLKQANEAIKTQNAEIMEQKEKIELSHRQITDSITYARRIQQALLPSRDIISQYFPEHFIFFKPRDIVSGDFYWAKSINRYLVLVTADCTGHGVPGAFMSMLGISFVNEIVPRRHITKASQILDALREQVKSALSQTGKDNETKDGMDISVCVIDMNTLMMQFAGAKTSTVIFRNNEEIVLKGDRMPIGIYLKEQPFSQKEFQLQKGDIFYIFSDGFVDQTGGGDGRKYLIKNFRIFLQKIHQLPINEQNTALEEELLNWRAHPNKKIVLFDQVDDILVMGVKV